MARWVKQWNSGPWTESVQGWISRVLQAYGVLQAGDFERISAGLGAVVYVVPTEAGPLYFKASAPARIHEAELVSRSAPHSKGLIPQPLAVELDEGWMLSPGLGRTMADQPTPADPRAWRRVFDEAGTLQRSLSASADALSEGGMPGFLPSGAAEYLDSALVQHASLPREHPLFVSGEDAEMLSQGLGTVEAAVQRLESVPIPATLQQGTLDPAQILVPASSRASHLFIGWGEARWSHPFGLIAEAVEQLCQIHGAEPTEPPVRGILDSYLAHFTDIAPAAELHELIGPASLVAKAQRHEALMDLLLDADPEDQAAHAPQLMRLLAGALAAPEGSARRSARGGTRQGTRAARPGARSAQGGGRRRAR